MQQEVVKRPQSILYDPKESFAKSKLLSRQQQVLERNTHVKERTTLRCQNELG